MTRWTPTVLLTIALASGAGAEELRYAVTGVDDAQRANVLAHVDTFQLGPQARLAEKDFPDVIAAAERRAREALRPFGFYAPDVRGEIRRRDDDALLLTLSIDRGQPMTVAAAYVDVVGDGAGTAALGEWRDKWPLQPGAVLDQAVWEEQKVRGIEQAEAFGFLDAGFSEHRLELNLDDNTAVLKLTLDTGPQYVFGDVDYGEHALKPGVLEFIPRFAKGDPYSRRLLDRFRADLWRTGYFANVEVGATRRTDVAPPQVDLTLTLSTTHKNTYQGSLGFGTDTGMRLQAQWSRRPMSRNGDRLDVGIGWQEQDDEMSLRTNYRLPRPAKRRQYWVADIAAKVENLDLEIKRRAEDEDFINIANGDVAEFHLRAGHLGVRNTRLGNRQLFGTAFVQYLNSDQQYDLLIAVPQLRNDHAHLLGFDDDVISVGYDLDLVDVRGKGFDTQGRRDRAWFFLSDQMLGSDMHFKQAYIGTQRIYRRGERWKWLVRGEIGYTDAVVDELTIDVGGLPVDLSVTQLPSFYRFKAGGSQSVRGYGFEALSNNDVGSNHIITASVEVEYRFLGKWSAAAFFDVGNAFNDWHDPNLHRGIGLGIRWYSIAGPIRVDVAQALDFTGRPWRIHFTIGTPLL